jgi:hypothetical protein
MVHLLSFEFSPPQAQLLTWLFFLLLPLVTVINYRFTQQPEGYCAFYYPYDTSTLFFITLGYRYCLDSRWLHYTLWLILSTLNRETSLLLILLIPALHGQRVLLKPLAYLPVAAYLLTRSILFLRLYHLPGHWIEWYLPYHPEPLFFRNMHWLLAENNLFLFIFCFAGLPLFWFAFLDYIPPRYRAVRFVVLIHITCLLLFGLFKEARIFSESVVLLYLPVCVAVCRWLAGRAPYPLLHTSLFALLNRHAVILVQSLLLFAAGPLHVFCTYGL